MIYLLLLALCSCSLASDVSNPPPIPSYPKKCPPIKALSDSGYISRWMDGFWYEVLASTNVKFYCDTYNTTYIGNSQSITATRARMENGTVVAADLHWQTGKSPNSDAKVMDIYRGYYYHMIMYVLDFSTPEMFVSYECFEKDGGIQEHVHAYAHHKNYDKAHVKNVLKAHNLTRIQTKEHWTDCPKDMDPNESAQ